VITENEFRKSLPDSTECDVCGRGLPVREWMLGRFGVRQWCGLGVAKCEGCSVVRVAAAGSDDEAHAYARATRLQFLKSIGQVH
jgi:ribosomal protein S14